MPGAYEAPERFVERVKKLVKQKPVEGGRPK